MNVKNKFKPKPNMRLMDQVPKESSLSFYRPKPEGKQNYYKENNCQADDFLQRYILNVDQTFNFRYNE